MFKSARIKLTGWYLLIIMLVSFSFSVAIYEVLVFELDRVERIQTLRQIRTVPLEFRVGVSRPRIIDPEIVSETKERLRWILGAINALVLVCSSVAGYFLAGRTLRPVERMVDEQNRFITDASHELRTPITSLKAEIEVNLRDKKLSRDAKKILRSNLEDVERLQTLSDGLIKLAQYEKNNTNGTFEKVLLLEVVAEAQKKVAGLAKRKNISIKIKVKETVLFADPQALSELFVILLDNAIKYSRANTSVVLDSRVSRRWVQVTVGDRGVGIKDEDIPHLFDRFYRVDKSRTNTKVHGYGLGLSIARKIVQKHRGTIKVNSREGQGTTFLVKLPLK